MSKQPQYSGLQQWAAKIFEVVPSVHDLRRMARDGRIQPPPFLIGRAYYLDCDARFVEKELSAEDLGPTTLYRHFDSAGTLLYVGISLCAVTRQMAHERESAWFREISTITLDHFPTRAAAIAAEARAIASEAPKHNIAGKPRWKLAAVPMDSQ